MAFVQDGVHHDGSLPKAPAPASAPVNLDAPIEPQPRDDMNEGDHAAAGDASEARAEVTRMYRRAFAELQDLEAACEEARHALANTREQIAALHADLLASARADLAACSHVVPAAAPTAPAPPSSPVAGG